MKTLILGLGNPILGDDGVGCRAAEEIRTSMGPDQARDIHVECASLGGLSLMERLVGYPRVILIDSIQTGRFPNGSVRVFPLQALPNPSDGHSASVHDTSLLTALETGRLMGLDLPTEIIVAAVEASAVYEFSEELSPAVAAAVPALVQAVLDQL